MARGNAEVDAELAATGAPDCGQLSARELARILRGGERVLASAFVRLKTATSNDSYNIFDAPDLQTLIAVTPLRMIHIHEFGGGWFSGKPGAKAASTFWSDLSSFEPSKLAWLLRGYGSGGERKIFFDRKMRVEVFDKLTDTFQDVFTQHKMAGQTPPSATGDNLIAQLERLAALHGRGDLTDEEFQAAKERLLQT